MSGVVAKRYARALFEVAKERGLIDEIEAELNAIVDVVTSNSELNKIMMHPHIAPKGKKELLEQLFQDRVKPETLNFLNVLVDNRRESDLAGVLSAFVSLANEERGIADAVVTTARPLSDAEQADIAKRFGEILNKTLRVHAVVDPSILGGIVVKIGDRLFDGSVKSKLEHFAHQVS